MDAKPKKATRSAIVALLRPAAIFGVLLGLVLMIDVSVTPVEACMTTKHTPDTSSTVAGETTTPATSATTAACPCPALSTLYRKLPGTVPELPPIKNGDVTYSTTVDSHNCQTSFSCSVKKGYVPRVVVRGGGGGRARATFGPINEPLVVPVSCDTSTSVWHIPELPTRRQPFNKFACFDFDIKCPCPKLSSLEKTNGGSNQVNVPLIIADPVLDELQCEKSSMVSCYAEDKKPFFRLTGDGPADDTTDRVNSVVSKEVVCKANTGTWRTKDSEGANYDFTGMRCYYKK